MDILPQALLEIKEKEGRWRDEAGKKEGTGRSARP
jgi:hypothetical protein